MNGVIYARYSSENQREESIDGQLRECTAFAQHNDIQIVGEYIDRAFSAKTDNRPSFQKMIKDSAKGEFDVIIVWKLDRFARNRYDSAHYKNILKKNGVKVVSATEAISSGAEGIILESVLEGMAEYYSAELAEKVSRGMKENALKCKYNGGSVPLGYYIDESKHFQIDSSVAPFVVECFEHYADGMTMKQLRDELNMKGVKNSRGGKLSIDVISRMLTNRKYLGEYTFQDITIKDGIPAIVSTSLFEKVQDRLTKTKKAPSSHKADDDYILTTKLFCGKCKSFMVGESGTNAQGKKYRYYKCVNHKKHQGCDMKSIRKDLIENMTIKYIREFLNDEDLINTLIDLAYDAQHKENEQLPLLRKQLAQTEKGIKNIVDAIEQGISTKSTRERLLDLEQRKNDIEMSISKESIENPMLTKKQFKFWFDQLKKLDISKSEQRQKLVDLFVNSIIIYDDHIKFFFNYKEHTETITFDELNNCSDLPDSPRPKRTAFRLSFFILLFIFGLVKPNFRLYKKQEKTENFWRCSIYRSTF
jgi:site-specific DNA recombinase